MIVEERKECRTTTTSETNECLQCYNVINGNNQIITICLSYFISILLCTAAAPTSLVILYLHNNDK